MNTLIQALHARFDALAPELVSIYEVTRKVGATGVCVFWFVGGTDPATYQAARAAGKVKDIPSNHSPRFAPALHPTLKTGLQAMLAAASAWLCGEGDTARDR